MAQSSSTSGTSSRRHLREHDVNSPSSPRYADGDLESKEATLHRELEEFKARAAQMDKTMRWWADCTANWREKYCEVRDERNLVKKEAKVLKTKLEAALIDLSTYQHESQELELQNMHLKQQMEKVHALLLKHAGQFDQQLITLLDSDPQLKTALGINELIEVFNKAEKVGKSTVTATKKEINSCKNTSNETESQSNLEKDMEEYISQGAVPKHTAEVIKDTSPTAQEKRHSKIDSANEEALMQKISTLTLRLEEATVAINAEREDKTTLHKDMEKLKNEIVQLKEKCEKLQISRNEALKELRELAAEHADFVNETSNHEGMDQRLSELRTELEKLQAENAAEWGKRERLETDKISLERENKQLRSELRELQEFVDAQRPRPQSAGDTSVEVRQLQQELLERNKELSDVKHAQAKLKKMLAEKTTELSHASRRSEQYEAEVKRIRARVEELKKELALVQDELDIANNSVRRLQRVNEDLNKQLDNASAQMEHYRNSISESRAPDVVAQIKGDKTRDNEDDELEDGKDC